MEVFVKTLLFFSFIIGFFYFFLRKKKLKLGFISVDSGHGMTKEYLNGNSIAIYHWGAAGRVPNGNDSYLGLCGVVKSTDKYLEEELSQYFDDLEMEEFEGGYLWTFKKKKMFFDSREFQLFVGRIDAILSK